MQLVSFVSGGTSSYGVLSEDYIIDLGRRFGASAPTLLLAIKNGLFDAGFQPPERNGHDPAVADVRFLMPIVAPGKVICIGRNYRGHVAEAGLKVPEFPSIFVRVLDSIVADGEPIIRPAASHHFDFEGELALIIGKPGRHIAADDAFEHIFGYSCFNDGSLRDYQMQHSLTAGKNFQASGAFGPCITPAAQIEDPTALEVFTHLNGEEMQHGVVADLIFSIPQLIAYISRFTHLHTGDVIATGTPDGVGFARKPPVWLRPGDEIVVLIPGVGKLKNKVVDEV